MNAHKWNYDTHSYDPVTISDRAGLFAANMDAVVDCAQCGQPTVVGGTYTSKEIHTHTGFGYMVCSKCYEQERDRELTSRK